MFQATNSSGFTLIELLIGVAIISLLTSLTVIMINPVKYLGDTKTATELFQANQIEKALLRIFSAKGALPNADSIPDSLESALPICEEGTDNYPDCINLDDIINDNVMASLPVGSRATVDTIGFSVYKNVLGVAHVIITPEAE